MYTYDWFVVLYGRNQHNSCKAIILQLEIYKSWKNLPVSILLSCGFFFCKMILIISLSPVSLARHLSILFMFLKNELLALVDFSWLNICFLTLLIFALDYFFLLFSLNLICWSFVKFLRLMLKSLLIKPFIFSNTGTSCFKFP